jgi:hypothetical protein
MTTPDFSAKLGQRAAPNLLTSKRAPAAIRSALTFIAQLRENVVAHEKTPNVQKKIASSNCRKCGESERGSIFPLPMSPSHTTDSITDQSVAPGHCGVFVVRDFLRKVARIGASERKGVAPWMIFVMRTDLCHRCTAFTSIISAEVVPAIISAMRSETRSATAIRAASNLVI